MFFNKSLYLFSTVATMLLSAPTMADWNLEAADSKVHFVSVKKDTIGEVHHFSDLNGVIMDSGHFVVNIPLATVDTQIDIRDDRMKQFLFEITKFPQATISGEVDPKVLRGLKTAEPVVLEVTLSINLHGQVVEKKAVLQAIKLDRKRILVNSTAPILIDAAEFSLAAGIIKLQELAGLPNIAQSIPVTVNLLFSK